MISLFFFIFFPFLTFADLVENGKFIPAGESYAKACEHIYELQKPDSKIFRVKTSYYDLDSKQEKVDALFLLCKKCSDEKSQKIKVFPPVPGTGWGHLIPEDVVSLDVFNRQMKETGPSFNCLKDVKMTGNKDVYEPQDLNCAKKEMFHQLTQSLPLYQKIELHKIKNLKFIDFYQTCRKFLIREEEESYLTTWWKNFLSKKNEAKVYEEIQVDNSSRSFIEEKEPTKAVSERPTATAQ